MWSSRGPDKRRECTGYRYRENQVSALAAEDGVRHTVKSKFAVDGRKIVSCPWRHGKSKTAADWYSTL